MHQRSIEKLEELLRRDGYVRGSVTGRVERDARKKEVSVVLHVDRRQYCSVTSTEQVFFGAEGIGSGELLRLKKRLYQRCIKKVLHGRYRKEIIEHEVSQVREFLALQGFPYVTVMVEEHVDHQTGSVHLIWYIDLHQWRPVIFYGNRFLSSRQLLEGVMAFGRSAWLIPKKVLSAEVEQAYRSKGFWNVQVDVGEEDGRRVLFVNEGKRARVDQVEIRNATYFSSEHIVASCFKRVGTRALFDQEKVQEAFDVLVDLYVKAGFCDVHIVDYSFEPSESSSLYRLVVTVDEGVRFSISDVRIEGYAQLHNHPGLFLESEHPIYLEHRLLLHQERWLKEYFRVQKQRDVMPVHEIIQEDGGRASVYWKVEGAQEEVRFGKTIVEGVCPVPFESVLSRLAYREGDIWDQSKLRQSFAQLREWGIFSGVRLHAATVCSDTAVRDVLLKIYEDRPIEARFRAGLELQYVKRYATNSGLAYRVGGTIMSKNTTKAGDILRLDADIARAHYTVNVQYDRPIVLQVPARVVVSGYFVKHNQPGYVGSHNSLYILRRGGSSIGLFLRDWRYNVGINVGVEWTETVLDRDVAGTMLAAERLARAINFDRRLLGRGQPYFFIESNLFIDHLDDKIDPHQGYFLVCSLRGVVPIGSRPRLSSFVRLLAEQACFIPIKWVTLAFRMRFGHIFHRRFNKIFPMDRFYLGGGHSLRGYEPDLAPPLGLFIDDCGVEHVVPRGGKSMLNVNVEARIPLNERVGGVLFQDAGFLSDDKLADFTVDKLLLSSGVGLRYKTPIGPLRFDIGWRWKRSHAGERSYAWVLNFGQAF